jgi:hypothetical protein
MLSLDACSFHLLWRFGDGRHGLGRATLLAAAATALALGLLGRVQWWQHGECRGHGVHAWWSRSLVEERAGKLVIKVLAEEVCVADV